ncbi:MAG: hypothetical protein EBQ80_02780 [Proteobacteria bacterium]|nr:hypothetical protein [Pseudomonadota bacterium]
MHKKQLRAIEKEAAALEQWLSKAFAKAKPKLWKLGYCEEQVLNGPFFAGNIQKLMASETFARIRLQTQRGHAQLRWHYREETEDFYYPTPNDSPPALPVLDDTRKVFLYLRVWSEEGWTKVSKK